MATINKPNIFFLFVLGRKKILNIFVARLPHSKVQSTLTIFGSFWYHIKLINYRYSAISGTGRKHLLSTSDEIKLIGDLIQSILAFCYHLVKNTKRALKVVEGTVWKHCLLVALMPMYCLSNEP